ncbi:MAG: hypothetical protein VX642_06065 [Bdellovibrionota bacterium]|nr:hypothetical protein [Bdellovibrionota bacterium]
MLKLLLVGIFYFNSLFAYEIQIGADGESYPNYKVRKLKTSSPSNLLNQKFIEAVKLYQSKESHKSFRLFKEIVAEAYLFEWPKVQRQSIAYSFLRLAEQNPLKRGFYINEAKKFYIEGNLSASSFSKHTINDLKSSVLRTMDFPLLHFFNSPHYVSINSKSVNLKNWIKLKLPEGPIRLVILSKNQEEFIFTGNTQNLLNSKISIKDLDYGTCLSPKLFDEDLKEKNYRIRYDKNCSYKYSAGVFVQDKRSITTSVVMPTMDNKDQIPKLKILSPKRKWKHWDKVAWGIGILATGLIYQHNNRTKKVVYSE